MIKKRLLKGLSVLITRPEGQGRSLGDAITKAGGKPVFFPLLRITPIQDEQSQAQVRKTIQRLDNYDMAIFISSNAVKYGLEWVNQYWPQFPRGLKVFAIGPVTAEALDGIELNVISSPSGMQSEDLLSLPELQHVAGVKIALFRGRGGRELLANTLRDRGALIDCIETYDRAIPDYGPKDLITSISGNDINVLCVTSLQILDSLCQLVDINKGSISLLPLLVPSERIRQAALAAGFLHVFNSAGATDQAILSGLEIVASNQHS